MKTVAVVQARMGSERLPGKVLKDVNGVPLLALLLRRVGKSQVDQVCVVCPPSKEDDPIEALCDCLGVSCFRHNGKPRDVLAEYVNAAEETGADLVVRITGDCPLMPLEAINAVLDICTHEIDLSTNVNPRTYPRGFDVEVVPAGVLKALKPTSFQREHVTLYLYENWSSWCCVNVPAPPELTRPHYRLTVDEPPDLELIRRIVGEIGPDCTAREIVGLLDSRPDLVAINAGVGMKVGTR